MIRYIAAAIVGLIAPPVESAAHSFADPLPAGWRADIGAPVELIDGTVIWLYGDTWTDDGGSARNTVVVEGSPILGALRATSSGSFYWPGDATVLPDGRLFVVMGEVREVADATDEERALGMAFEGVDSDAFIVSDPTSVMSWRLAEKIDVGPWDGLAVQFSDQWPLVFVRGAASFVTEVSRYDPADPSGLWTPVEADLPESFGMFTAVQTGSGWWGIAASDWHHFAWWHADDLTGVWERVSGFTTEGRTYDHQLNVVAGRVVHRWSNGEGSMRPVYEDVTDRL